MSDLAANDLIRRLAIFGALNLLILTLILASVSGNGNEIFLGFILGLGLLLLFFGSIVIVGFFQKKNGYDVRLANLEQFLSVIFLSVGLIQTIVGLIAIEIFLITQGLLLVLLGNSTRKRVSTIRNPQFIDWYTKDKPSDVTLRTEEVYASCPHCSSLLAVIPNLLAPHDRCPNCDGLLVSSIEEE
ncbi:MAG: hypothetical protein ACPG7N_02480 [Candidatus Thalassarchaeaceae archaeon]